MSQAGETFFTSIGCMDGRVHQAILLYGQNKFGVKYADTITEAGLVGLLANNPSKELLGSIKKKVLISVEKHRSRGIIIHGHSECAGNPVDETLHREQTLDAASVIRNLISGDIEVMPVFVIRNGEDWAVEEL